MPGVAKASLEVLLLHTEVAGLAVDASGWFELGKEGELEAAEQLLLGASPKLLR